MIGRVLPTLLRLDGLFLKLRRAQRESVGQTPLGGLSQIQQHLDSDSPCYTGRLLLHCPLSSDWLPPLNKNLTH